MIEVFFSRFLDTVMELGLPFAIEHIHLPFVEPVHFLIDAHVRLLLVKSDVTIRLNALPLDNHFNLPTSRC